MPKPVADITAAVEETTAHWREDRRARQLRRQLDPAEFDLLRQADLLRLIAPADVGGLWEGPATSARPLCEIYRRLAGADASVALVSSMHPAVISCWLVSPANPAPE